MDWDVIVIGAGAAGLLAAARAAERGRRTLLLEKNRKAGVKILISGGTRCNLTHDTDARGIVEAFGRPGRFLNSAVAAFPPQALVDLVEAEGVPTRVEPPGKIFPASGRAGDVLGAFLRRLERSGATLALEEPVKNLRKKGGGFEIVTPKRTLTATRVIVTVGGQSYPGCGTTGDGYAWARRLGHAVAPPRPSLTPVTVDLPWVHALKGVTIPDVEMKVVGEASGSGRQESGARRQEADGRKQTAGSRRQEAGGRRQAAGGGAGDPGSGILQTAPASCLARRRGSLLFTHFGLSGPVVLDVSREITGHPEPRSLALECDFLPDLTEGALEERIRQAAIEEGRKTLTFLLADALPRSFREAVLGLVRLDPGRKIAELTKEDRRRLVLMLKALPIPVAGTLGFAKAEVTAGGVALDEVDSRTLESKKVPGLHFAGEILDLDGPIGGYNFQAAFSTGWQAGGSV